jgi:hypothetical protein
MTCTKTLRILAFVYKANLGENFTSVSACESEALEAWEDLDLELNLRSPCSNRSEILLYHLNLRDARMGKGKRSKKSLVKKPAQEVGEMAEKFA